MQYDKENKVLMDLIEINMDASAFYKSAIARVRNPRLERSFADLERMHATVVSDLSQRVRMNGGDPQRADGTLTGKTIRVFTEMMAKLRTNVDETLVIHLEEAEDRCLHSMRDSLESRDLSPDTRALLVSELGHLQRSHDYMKALKDSMQEANHQSSRAA